MEEHGCGLCPDKASSAVGICPLTSAENFCYALSKSHLAPGRKQKGSDLGKRRLAWKNDTIAELKFGWAELGEEGKKELF